MALLLGLSAPDHAVPVPLSCFFSSDVACVPFSSLAHTHPHASVCVCVTEYGSNAFGCGVCLCFRQHNSTMTIFFASCVF
jgi:hypothetical protein